jgi:adenosylcobyric acid synthase
MSRGKAVMVLGTTSGAGKSWLATALCRWYARQGLKVAPFKAQNMSNNARVVPGLNGLMGEIGSAQYFQALAARRVPEVRMNPVLLKPEADTRSQVVVMGEVDPVLSGMPWRERSALLRPRARAALHELLQENDVVVIEGAGSPAEINLAPTDYVNLGTARDARAACLLVTDIDRGGAFAHLYGTHQLMPEDVRAQVRGFVLNRFRGDAGLLAPGPEQLEQLTGVPTIATLPMWRGHGLPEEDGVYDDPRPASTPSTPRGGPAVLGSGPADGRSDDRATGAGSGLHIAVIAYPRISNLDEFQPLRQLPGVRLSWAREPRDLQGADWIILPGSKSTAADLAWLRAQKLDAAISTHRGRVLGICGGLQMLGEALIDPHGLDGNAPGLGLLPLVTVFEPEKLLRSTAFRFAAELAAPWQALADVQAAGYEIRHGRTQPHAGLPPPGVALRNTAGEAVGWQSGHVLGVYAHGLFEQPALLQALFGQTGRPLEAVFDGLADFIDLHFQPGKIASLID